MVGQLCTLGEREIRELTFESIDSAKMIIEICDDVSRSGLLLRGHWIALEVVRSADLFGHTNLWYRQFLFSAVLMIVADCVRVARIGQMEAWNENHNYIARGVSILQSGRRGSSMVKYQVETVNKILRSLTLLYGKWYWMFCLSAINKEKEGVPHTGLYIVFTPPSKSLDFHSLW